MHPGRNDLRIIENHQSFFRKQIRKVTENKFVDTALTVMQQFGRIPFRKRIFGNPFVRERIVIIFDVYFRYHR